MENQKLKIGVIGLGLIGGSILKALYQKGYSLVAVSKSNFKAARDFSDFSSDDINDVKNCNVVFVCSKMNETPSVLDRLESIVSSDCVVADVCSLKRFVNEKQRPYNFIGSHPMAGTEFSGFEHSFKELFKGAKWVLNRQNALLETLIKDMGAYPFYLDEKAHDMEACLISHLPMVLATALFKTVQDNYIKALKIASSGFRDTTRLSLTNKELAYDMLSLNRDNLNLAIEDLIKNLNEIKRMDKEEFFKTIEAVQNLRNSMYDRDGKNIL